MTEKVLYEQQNSLESYRNAVIQDAIRTGKSPDLLGVDLSKIDVLLNDVAKRMKAFEEQQRDDVAPSYLYESAGYYSSIAKADWSDAIDRVKTSNAASYSINAIPTANVGVYVSVMGAGGFQPNELLARVNVENFANIASVVDGIQVDVEPTKIGACFMNFPHIIGGEAAAYPFGMSINYTYDVAISTKVTASYNLRDVYEYVSKSGKSSNLFSSRSWKEITESSDVDELLELKIEFGHNATPAEEQAERTRVREYLLGYAISDMVKRSVPDGPIGKTGAIVASETLTKTCGANSYCAGAAAGLAILDGLFGSGKNEVKITQTLDVKRTYNSEVTKAVPVPGSISFITAP